MNNSIITVKNISKKYTITHQRGGYVAMRDVLTDIAKKPFSFLKNKAKQITGKITKEEFWALKDINFEVQKGEAIGIIGANGAGKSTLLKILTGITPPTTGEIRMNGKVASLLEVGTGFHQELTGRENIFLNGAILGMSKKEIAKKFDAIVEFSGVEKFIDTPVKRYSSGMLVRLGFSVAAHMEPDILLVDEVLAVGDAEFQKKCLGKMDEVTKQAGRTILFVSHNLTAVQNLCKRCILLEEGKIKMIGETKKVINDYLKEDTLSKNSSTKKITDNILYKNKNIELQKITCNDSPQKNISISNLPTNITIKVNLRMKEKNKLTLETCLKDKLGNHLAVYVPGHTNPNNVFLISPGEYSLTAKIKLPKLNKGTYFLDFNFTNPGIESYAVINNAVNLNVLGYVFAEGRTFDADTNGAGYQVLDGEITIK
ncbi:MAG: ATP-binding cassette domain-containing protein [Candidatus Pacebacteria bacterium]|nr:ATP-binding cassette domain-containing protein [Candidatus Paceibacterota bacterium]